MVAVSKEYRAALYTALTRAAEMVESHCKENDFEDIADGVSYTEDQYKTAVKRACKIIMKAADKYGKVK